MLTDPWLTVGASQSSRNGRTVNLTRRLAWLAAAGIVISLLIMILGSVTARSITVPPMPRPSGPLPLELQLKVPDSVILFLTWAAAVLGGGGVITGLIAVARGARFPVGLMIVGGLMVVAIFAVLPAAGSTDTISYAAYGRMALLGHNPYTTTPAELAKLGDPIGQAAMRLPYWHHIASLYGPIATGEQYAAAWLGGTSVALIAFWLKLWNAIVFAAVALGLDRLVRSDPARRARVHLLWTVNPLLIWTLVAGGHLDLLAAGVGYLALFMLRPRTEDGRVALPVALGAGLLIGLAADIMLDYLLFALAVGWALRRQWPALATAAAGVCITLVPATIWAGEPYVKGFGSRDGFVGADSFYQLLSPAFKHKLPTGASLVVDLAFIGLALLLLWRLPDGPPDMPAIRPALAITLSWLFLWYYTLPWYDTMSIGLLAVYPASRLDWAVIGQFTIGSFANLPGLVYQLRPHWVTRLAADSAFRIMPLLLFVALLALVWLCVSRRWGVPVRREAHHVAPQALSGAAAQEPLVG